MMVYGIIIKKEISMSVRSKSKTLIGDKYTGIGIGYKVAANKSVPIKPYTHSPVKKLRDYLKVNPKISGGLSLFSGLVKLKGKAELDPDYKTVNKSASVDFLDGLLRAQYAVKPDRSAVSQLALTAGGIGLHATNVENLKRGTVFKDRSVSYKKDGLKVSVGQNNYKQHASVSYRPKGTPLNIAARVARSVKDLDKVNANIKVNYKF